MPTAGCPAREDLFAYLVGTLPGDRARAVSEHLDGCTTCLASLETITTENETLIGRLSRPVDAEPYSDEPQREEAIARARALAGSSPTVAGDRASPADAEVAVPERLAEYEVLAVLGQGGMGVVYQARHTKLDRLVALKALRKGMMRDERARARFDREMKAVGRLSHPNIVQALDAREVDGTALLVTEYIDGWDLSQLVERTGPLPIADACEIVRQTAVGLEYIHAQGMVHRDIKPSNVMLNRGGQVKILDLGLALLLVEEPVEGTVTTAGQVMGTADYMAPEQAGRSHQVDIRADIYSLGCMLYKLLTGAAPFAGTEYDTPAQKIVAHARDAPRPIAALRPGVPEGLATVVERMMAKERQSRYSTPAEVAEALAPFAEGADLAMLLGQAAVGTPGAVRPAPIKAMPQGSSRPAQGPLAAQTAPAEAASVVSEAGPRVRRRAFAIVLGGLGVLALLAVVLKLRTSEGTLIVELNEPDATVQVLDEQGTIQIQRAADGGTLTIAVAPGKHRLRVEKDGFQFYAAQFEMESRGRRSIAVHLAPEGPGKAQAAALAPREVPVATAVPRARSVLPADCPDFAEGNAAGFEAEARDGAATSLIDLTDRDRVRAGKASLWLETRSRDFVTLTYPRTRNAGWDLSQYRYLRVGLCPRDTGTHFVRFLGLRLGNGANYVELTRSYGTLRETGLWSYLLIPLAGSDLWKRSPVGVVDPRSVDWVQLRLDGEGGTFSVGIDDLAFLRGLDERLVREGIATKPLLEGPWTPLFPGPNGLAAWRDWHRLDCPAAAMPGLRCERGVLASEKEVAIVHDKAAKNAVVRARVRGLGVVAGQKSGAHFHLRGSDAARERLFVHGWAQTVQICHVRPNERRETNVLLPRANSTPFDVAFAAIDNRLVVFINGEAIFDTIVPPAPPGRPVISLYPSIELSNVEIKYLDDAPPKTAIPSATPPKPPPQ